MADPGIFDRRLEWHTMPARTRAFDVYLNGKWIDCVFYSRSTNVTIEEVRNSLVNHDGYDPNIEVFEASVPKSLQG